MKTQKLKSGINLLDAAIIADIELYRTSVLNQLSHTTPVSLVRKEVEDARIAVENLKNKLQAINRNDLQ